MTLFTVEEANALLPKLIPLVARLVGIRSRIQGRQPALAEIIEQVPPINGGSRSASDSFADLQRFEQLIAAVNDLGCLLKDVDTGLVDFPAEIDGRDVYLCWQLGEETVSFWHDRDAGYAGRRPL